MGKYRVSPFSSIYINVCLWVEVEGQRKRNKIMKDPKDEVLDDDVFDSPFVEPPPDEVED